MSVLAHTVGFDSQARIIKDTKRDLVTVPDSHNAGADADHAGTNSTAIMPHALEITNGATEGVRDFVCLSTTHAASFHHEAACREIMPIIAKTALGTV